MKNIKYSPELIEQVLKDLESTSDAALVAQRHGVPKHAVYRFRCDKMKGPEISKDKKIKELSRQLADKDLETKILRELLKKLIK